MPTLPPLSHVSAVSHSFLCSIAGLIPYFISNIPRCSTICSEFSSSRSTTALGKAEPTIDILEALSTSPGQNGIYHIFIYHLCSDQHRYHWCVDCWILGQIPEGSTERCTRINGRQPHVVRPEKYTLSSIPIR